MRKGFYPFEFLRASSYKNTGIMGEGFRLRTLRFRGQISQGLLLPLSLFPEIPFLLNTVVEVSSYVNVTTAGDSASS